MCVSAVARKDTPNHTTAKREAEIAATGLTPLDYLLSVMWDEKREDAERLKAATAAAPYVHPKLESVEIRGMMQIIEQPVPSAATTLT